MDPLDVNFLPPPAYSPQEFDQKTSRATELSLELAKWERPKVNVDEEGFPPYDPAMFEEPPRVQKGKEQPTTTTFRSSSISKRPLPNPKSSTSSTDAGPSTRRQTQPLHISKKSISKAEEAAREATRSIPASSQQSIPNQSNYTPEDIPPYAAQDLSVSTPGLQSVPSQSIEDTSEDNPPYTPMNPHVATSSLQSIPNQSIEDTPENNPPYEPNYPAQPPYDEQRVENWEEDGTSRQEVISEPVPNVPLDRPQSAELEHREHSTQGRELLNPNTINQMLDTQSQYSTAHNPPFHRGPQVNPNMTTMSDQHDMQSPYSTAPTPPFHRGSQLNPGTGTTSNQMLDLQSQYSIAPNPPVHRGPQHFSLPPVPRSLPRINPSDRPRSTLSPPAAPRVLFNPNVAYGKHAMGGPVPQFRPKVTPQTPFQAHFDPHMFYNSAVSSQMNAQMTMPDQSPHLSHQVQRPQVWPSQSYSSPASSAVNQSRQWGWHPPGRPSDTYGSVTDTSYGGGGTDVSRYSMANNGYFNQ